MSVDAVKASSSRAGLAQVCAAGVLWGTGGLVLTVLHDRDGLGAMTVSAWRMLIGAVALIGFAAVAGHGRTVVETFRAHPARASIVGCGTAAYQGLYFASVLLVGVSVATVVALGLAPLLASGWEHLRARTRPTAREVLVLTGALTGLVLISASADHGSGSASGDTALGLVLAVAGGCAYAATTVVGHGLAQAVGPVALTTCATTAGAVVLAPFLVVAFVGDGPAAPGDVGSVALLLYLGVATMALSYGLLYAGLRTTSGSAATVATLVEPVSAAVLAVLLLDERLPWPAVLGGVLILLAVAALRPGPAEVEAPH